MAKRRYLDASRAPSKAKRIGTRATSYRIILAEFSTIGGNIYELSAYTPQN